MKKMLKTLDIRENILEYLQTANKVSPHMLQMCTRLGWISPEYRKEIEPSPIVANTDNYTSGLGLINGLLLFLDEKPIIFEIDEETNKILKIE